MPVEVSTAVVGLEKVTVIEEPSVTAFEYGPDESAPVTVSVLTVVVLQGSAMVIVNSTLSLASVGANEVAPDWLLDMEIVFCTLTVWVPIAFLLPVFTLIRPGAPVS